MSPEAQRIAIAEACGWKEHRHEDGGIRYYRGIHHENSVSFANLPDYSGDLNAMHRAEKVLGTSQCIPYLHNLILIVDPKGYRQGWEWRTVPLISATAAQRAEAFLRCIGKWEDSAP